MLNGSSIDCERLHGHNLFTPLSLIHHLLLHPTNLHNYRKWVIQTSRKLEEVLIRKEYSSRASLWTHISGYTCQEEELTFFLLLLFFFSLAAWACLCSQTRLVRLATYSSVCCNRYARRLSFFWSMSFLYPSSSSACSGRREGREHDAWTLTGHFTLPSTVHNLNLGIHRANRTSQTPPATSEVCKLASRGTCNALGPWLESLQQNYRTEPHCVRDVITHFEVSPFVFWASWTAQN